MGAIAERTARGLLPLCRLLKKNSSTTATPTTPTPPATRSFSCSESGPTATGTYIQSSAPAAASSCRKIWANCTSVTPICA